MYGLCRKYDENGRALPPPRPLLYMPRRATSSTPSTAQQPSAPPPPAIPSRHLPPPPTDFSSSVTQSQDRAHARCRQGQPPRLGAPCLCDDPPHLCHRGGPTIQARGDPRGHPQALLSWRSSLRQPASSGHAVTGSVGREELVHVKGGQLLSALHIWVTWLSCPRMGLLYG
jgi:hypothetical protein